MRVLISYRPVFVCLVASLSGLLASAQTVIVPAPVYVTKALLHSRLQDPLALLGDRLEQPGKERLTLNGTLTRETETTALLLIWQLPGLFRIEQSTTAGIRTIGFDGTQVWVSSGTLTEADRELVEALVNDTADHFFIAQSQGQATRVMGYFFRTDDGKSATYAGPFFDIYQVVDPLTGDPSTRRFRYYFINSRTWLLERVFYRITRGEASIPVETQIGGWRDVQGQKFPATVIRLENSQRAWSVAFSTAVVGPSTSDGIFVRPPL